ncbi:iron-siderophore ABC transporter substrate-binding protein [Desertimonas flava]|uniref:iron-siderophore ABC transporter substrate-binding protein n=1 Tax=Desertimonas flava TaxID=2064846 RepID=UPI000E3454D8|nr:iron-siderophore ABC transporter substrate-binding protein [Desertimonas flava]
MKLLKARAIALAVVTAAGVAAPALSSAAASQSPETDAAQYPIVIEHALGTTTIESKPERVATVNWANHEVPLALGVVPVGFAAANFGDDDGDGLLPWVSERLEELGAEVPVLFDETDGIDFEAVADTEPDVILAAYSGLTEEDYETLSEIAPTVAYPEAAWATGWRDMIELNSTAMGMAAEGAELIASIEDEIAETVGAYPELEGRTTMFMTHIDPTDLSEIGFYTTHDTRVQFFTDLGLAMPPSIDELSAGTDRFALSQSSEQMDVFDDVDIIVTYGDENDETLAEVAHDPLLSQIPAIERGSVVTLPGSSPLGTAANPTPLAISWVLEDYVALLAEAAAKVG